MAKKTAMRRPDVDFTQLQDRIFRRIHRTGEEVKNDLPNALRMAIEVEAWTHFTNPQTGKPFKTVEEWLHHDLPQGVAVGMGKFAITYHDLVELCRDAAPDVAEVLKKNAPKNGRRARRSNGTAPPECKVVSRDRATRAGLSERLAQDFPRIWQKYLAGQYRSVRAAAEAAGIVRPSHDPLMRLKSYWKRADKKARRDFLRWVDSAEGRGG